MNPEFKDILDKADKIKARQKAEEVKQAEREAKKIKKKKFEHNVLTFKNYRSFRIKYIGFFWYIIGLSIPIPLFFIIPDKTFQLICYSLFGIFVLRVLYHYISMYWGYTNFQLFFKNLHFPLIGWVELLNANKFRNFTYWRDVSITINYKNNIEIPEKVRKALKTIFISKANSNFYTPDFPSDQRKEWHVSANNILEGSLNSGVAGDFYLFLKKELVPLNEKHNWIENIEINILSDAYEVEPLRVSSEGTAS